MSDNCNKKNPDHSKQIPRINRIIGQLEGIKKMIDENRYCPDIIIQLSAIRSAVSSVEANILQDHLHSCVSNIFTNSPYNENKKNKINEISKLFKQSNR